MSEAEGVEDAGKGPSDNEPAAIPYVRYKQVAAERSALKDELKAARGQLEKIQSEMQQFQTAAADAASLREELGLVRAGLTDPEAIDVARTLWRRLPEDKRPATVAEYVESVKEAPPKALAAYLGQQVAAVDPTPKPTGGNGRHPDAEGSPTAEAIRAARIKAARTPPGSPEWKEFQRLADAARRR